MNICVKIVNDQLICIKSDHNEQVMLVIVDDQVPLKDRFLCSKCLKTHQSVAKIMPIDSAIASLKEKIAARNQKEDEQRNKSLQILQQFCNNMKDLQTKFIQMFNEIQRISSDWIRDLEKLEQKDDLINILQEFEGDNIHQNFDVQKNNKAYFIKLSSIFKKLLEFQDIGDCYAVLKKMFIKENPMRKLEQKYQQPQQMKVQDNIKVKVSQVQLIQSVKQQEGSRAMAFNCQGTIMVSGCENDIVVWKFDNGEMIQEKKLQGHKDLVISLMYSKKLDWFVSGSKDNTIICWKKYNNNKWISGKPREKHTDVVMCFILSDDENQLISCSFDNNIIVWKVNCNNNQLDYDCTLDQKHTKSVYCISLNESETALVSCGYDKQIILWTKDNNNKWSYLHHITNNDSGKRISFINDYQIVWQQCSKGITHLFQIQDNKLNHKPEFSIELNKETTDNWLFPTIFNKSKQIIIQKHNKYVYILQKQEDGKLYQAYQPIDCNNYQNYGTLSNDGEYLVIWDLITKEYRVYNIQYE